MLKTSKQLDSDAFKQLFEGMGDTSLIFKGGHFISANQAAVDLLNYPDKATLIKRLPAEISPPNQPDGQELHITAQHEHSFWPSVNTYSGLTVNKHSGFSVNDFSWFSGMTVHT